MSLPDGFLDELRARTSIADVVGRKVMWDQRKSQPGKGDMWAPCPFHQEKTASFHVDDKKGYYYCFGCQAKGDAIGFLRETENMSFLEAVETLARDAGMEMPARDPAAQARAEAGVRLGEVMEQAVRFYRRALQGSAGAAARAYLEQRRGLSRAAQDRWEIGYAPDGWQALWDHLRGNGVPGEAILEAGLANPSKSGGKPYDCFRNRIMFPIRDARGRTIGFGGRAMDPGEAAKYINSRETPLFDKGRALFNIAQARKEAGPDTPLIVAEGYMDVIALSEAGFKAAVAPLGTAVTEHQLALLWRISAEPVLALDGDAAGLRAALRVIDLALPRLEAGRSLRFCLLPSGQDPDDLLRAKGAAEMQRMVAEATPLVAMLWRRETEAAPLDTPERRAALDRRLRALLATIPDPDVRNHYGTEFKRLRRELFPAFTRRPSGDRTSPVPVGPTVATRRSLLVAQDAGEQLREAVILSLLIEHPELIAEFSDRLERFTPADRDHAEILAALLESDLEDAAETVEARCGPGSLERLRAAPHVRLVTQLHVGGDVDRARACLGEEFAKLEGDRGLHAEISEASADPDPAHGDPISWRIREAVRARHSAVRAFSEDRAEFVTGANGLRLDKKELDALRALLTHLSEEPGK